MLTQQSLIVICYSVIKFILTLSVLFTELSNHPFLRLIFPGDVIKHNLLTT